MFVSFSLQTIVVIIFLQNIIIAYKLILNILPIGCLSMSMSTMAT
jgi:hypothetical protein